ncbi:MAG: hypothetical protein CM15mP74_24480 [Halieaceae bacterium]|nr:MAG: hypothetical protein CM15mP74_24480 [Halieaceae bacterium]
MHVADIDKGILGANGIVAGAHRSQWALHWRKDS